MFSFFEHLFLPRPTNNHRARILHPKGVTFLLSLLISTQIILLYVSKIRPDVLGYATNISVSVLLEETNKKRSENGIPPLVLNEQLSQAAAGKARDMFTNNYWAHVSPSGTTPWDFIIGASYQYVYAGENLAKDFQDAPGVVNAWMDSSTHKENLLQEKYKDVGFAVVNGILEGEETTLIVQMFGSQSTKQVAAPAIIVILTPTPSPLLSENNIKPTVIPTIIIPVNNQNNNPPDSFLSAQMAVNKNPKFNLFNLSKDLNIIFVGLLIVVLVIDACFVSKHKIVRISGNNLAHIFLLTSLFATILLINRGSIL